MAPGSSCRGSWNVQAGPLISPSVTSIASVRVPLLVKAINLKQLLAKQCTKPVNLGPTFSPATIAGKQSLVFNAYSGSHMEYSTRASADNKFESLSLSSTVRVWYVSVDLVNFGYDDQHHIR